MEMDVKRRNGGRVTKGPGGGQEEVFVVSASASVSSGRSLHIDFVKYPATLALFQKVVGVRG
jgi:hypothetical protein